MALYTDGVTEHSAGSKQHSKLFGREKLAEVIERNGRKSAGKIAAAVEAALKKHSKQKLGDDATFMAFKAGRLRRPKPAASTGGGK